MYGITYLDLELTPPERAWGMLRGLRAYPPGCAATRNRKKTFNAALEQSEEFFRATASVGPAVRPTLAFYGLSQAGRAIAAASRHSAVSNTRYNIKGHGIGALNIEQADKDGMSNVVVVNGKHGGAFGTLAEVLNAGSLRVQTTIGALWSLLPESSQVSLENASSTRFLEVEEAPRSVRRGKCVQAQVRRIPAEIAGVRNDYDEVTPKWDWSDVHRRVNRYLCQYPGLKGAVMDNETGATALSEQGLTVHVHWPSVDRVILNEPQHPGQRTVAVREVVDDKQFIAERTVLYRGLRCAYPDIGQTGVATHPFLVWWAVLYAMSVIARYQPLTWGRLIEVNCSKDAAAIEQILECSIRVLPELIHRTILEVTERENR